MNEIYVENFGYSILFRKIPGEKSVELVLEGVRVAEINDADWDDLKGFLDEHLTEEK